MSEAEGSEAGRVPGGQYLALAREDCEAVGSTYFIAEFLECPCPILLCSIVLQEAVAGEPGIVGAVCELVFLGDLRFEVFCIRDGSVLGYREFFMNVERRGVFQRCFSTCRVSHKAYSTVTREAEYCLHISLGSLAD